MARETQARPAPAAYLELRMLAENFEDVQKARIACGNRKEGCGLDPGYYEMQEAALEATEELVKGELLRCYYRTVDPEIIAWQKATKGVGDHLLARLLGVIGHPVHTTVHRHEGPERKVVVVGAMDRSVSQLWSYCGHGDPERKRRKGMSQEAAMALGSPRAKMITRLIAEHIVTAMGPMRSVYDEGRTRYATRTADDGECWKNHKVHGWHVGVPAIDQHENACAHCNNAALCLLGKAFLKELCLAAGGSKAGEGGQSRLDTQSPNAPLALIRGGAL